MRFRAKNYGKKNSVYVKRHNSINKTEAMMVRNGIFSWVLSSYEVFWMLSSHEVLWVLRAISFCRALLFEQEQVGEHFEISQKDILP